MESRNWKLPFFTIWTGQAVSLLGSSLVQFALIWWLTLTTGSAAVLATATTAALLPTIFLGPFAGALVDRWPRKWVLILSDGSTALFTALLSILFWLNVAQPWHVFVILFLRAIGDTFQNPAMMSTTPLMVPKSQLTRISGMNSTLNGALRFAAPPLGALLLDLIGVRGMLPLDVLTAMLAILPLFFIPVTQPVATRAGKGPRAVLGDLRDGLRYIWDWRALRLLATTKALFGFVAQPIISFLPLLVVQYFRGDALQLGWVRSAYGIGALVGGLLVTTSGGFKRRMTTSIWGLVGFCAFMGLVCVAPPDGYWLAVVGYAVAGLATPFYNAGIRAIEQSVVVPEMQGRYFAD